MTDNNRWRKPDAQYPPALLAQVRRLVALGRSQRQIAESVGLSMGSLQRMMRACKIESTAYNRVHTAEPRVKTHRPAAPRSGPEWTGDPPSAAMVRLAQYDPVVARAMRVRLGLDAESDGPA